MGERSEQACYLYAPVGWLSVTADADGITAVQLISDPPKTVAAPTFAHLKEAYRQLGGFFNGERLSFSLPLSLRGTPQQEAIWRALANVPFGTTVTPKDIARAIGSPQAARAVVLAAGHNPLPVIIPCHRLVDDSASGQAHTPPYSAAVREVLLTLEGISLSAAAPTLVGQNAER